MRILAISGSLQAKSQNVALLEVAAASAPPDVEFILSDALRDLPHFNPDLETTGVPETVARWRQALAECEAVLIACPSMATACPEF